jgi:hypothetical protein
MALEQDLSKYFLTNIYINMTAETLLGVAYRKVLRVHA